MKLHNVVSPMVAEAKIIYMRRRYKPGQLYDAHEAPMIRALAALTTECGLRHVSLAEWVAPLRAVVPGGGARVDVEAALWAERADGVSLEALSLALPQEELLAMLAAIPHAALRDAALFDLLTMQGDRHAENVFVARRGRYFKLIDRRVWLRAGDAGASRVCL